MPAVPPHDRPSFPHHPARLRGVRRVRLRTRTLLLDARASLEMAPRVAELMAAALGRDADWQDAQVQEYRRLAQHYLLQ